MSIIRESRVGITGGSGALGRCLARALYRHGCREIALFDCAAPAFQSDAICFQGGDILRAEDLERGLRGCAVVFHLAAFADPQAAIVHPERCMEVNVLGTIRVMGVCRRLGVRRIIFSSTAQVYGLPLTLPVDEDHSTAPRSIYGASKLAAEVVAGAYSNVFGAVTVARLANLYGGTVGPKTVIGRAVDCVLSGRAIQLRSMEEVRDFLYIEDAAEALVRLAARTDSGVQTVNVSTGIGVSVAEAIRELAHAAEEQGLPRPEVLPPTGEPDREVPVFVLDNRRLGNLSGWTPSTPIRQGLSDTLGRHIQKP
jgi:nucleoside-diphosphate-sugar epimerase